MKKLKFEVFTGHDQQRPGLAAARAKAVKWVNENITPDNLINISESFCSTAYGANSHTLEVTVWHWAESNG